MLRRPHNKTTAHQTNSFQPLSNRYQTNTHINTNQLKSNIIYINKQNTGHRYVGVEFCSGLCGVSVVRSGESMETALRECCQGEA